MKLNEIKRLAESRADTYEFKDLDLWCDGTYGLESCDVEVSYDYEGASYTDHPYGSTTAREHHSARLDVLEVLLMHDSKVYDDDEGDKVIDTLKKGTDLMKLDWWKQSWTEWLAEKIHEKVDADIEADKAD